MIGVMTSPGHGAAPHSARRVAGRSHGGSRLTVRSASKRERFGHSQKHSIGRAGKRSGLLLRLWWRFLRRSSPSQPSVVASRTPQANTRQQTSDRFVKAIEQLGNDTSTDVRIGGIYGLEQLARDSPSDHPAVFDVLTAFVRGHVPAGTGKCTDPNVHLSLGSTDAAPMRTFKQRSMLSRGESYKHRKDQVLDLSQTCLVGPD